MSERSDRLYVLFKKDQEIRKMFDEMYEAETKDIKAEMQAIKQDMWSANHAVVIFGEDIKNARRSDR